MRRPTHHLFAFNIFRPPLLFPVNAPSDLDLVPRPESCSAPQPMADMADVLVSKDADNADSGFHRNRPLACVGGLTFFSYYAFELKWPPE